MDNKAPLSLNSAMAGGITGKRTLFILHALIVVFLLTISFPGSSGQAGQAEYYNLVNALFNSYNKNVRPTTAGELTLVRINMILKSIVSLDEKNQILESYATLDIQWNDDYLQWDPATYGNISRILYPQKQMWVPDIINENSVESQVQMGYDQLMCAISSDGTIVWRPSEIFKTSCDIDVSYYPFDTQSCHITFTTMMSNQEEIDIDPYSTDTIGVNLQDYSDSATWELVSTDVSTPDRNDEFTRLKFTLNLKRLRLYYALNIVMPVLVLSLTSSVVFYLPAESGEKVGMAITILLSYTVYLTIVAEKMPETSAQVSLFEVFIAIQLTLSAVSVILSVVVLNLHHRDEDIPISPDLEQRTRVWRNTIGLGPPRSHARRNQVYPAPNNEEKGNGLRLRRANTWDSLDDTLQTDAYKKTDKPSHMYGDDDDGEIPLEQEEITWPKVAQTLDRLLFMFYTFLIMASTLIIIPLMVILSEAKSA